MSVRFFLDKTRQKKHSGGEVVLRCAICIRGVNDNAKVYQQIIQ